MIPKKILTFLISISIIIGSTGILMAFDTFEDDFSDIIILQNDYLYGSTTYTLEYWENHNILWKNQLDTAYRDSAALYWILFDNQNISIESYFLAWNSLESYYLDKSTSDVRNNGYTFTYFLNKYAPSKKELMRSDPFSLSDSQEILTAIQKWIFGRLYNFSDNKDQLDIISSNLASQLYFIKDNNSIQTLFPTEDLANIEDIFSLEFSKLVNQHLQYYYSSKENLFGSKKPYLDLDFTDITGSYDQKVILLNTNYNQLVDIVNQNFSSNITSNINDNFISFDSNVSWAINNAISNWNTWFPNSIFITDTKTSLFTDLNNRRAEILNDLSNYKSYLLQRQEDLNNANSWSTIDYTNWISEDNWDISFQFTDNGEQYTLWSVWTWFIDYEATDTDNNPLSILDFSTSDSQDIISSLIDRESLSWDKVDTRQDYWISLARNIDKYNDLLNFLSWSTSLSDALFVDSINFNLLLKNEVKNEFINNSDLKTVRDISQFEFSNSVIDLSTWNALLRNELLNYGTLLINNQNISKNTIFPSTSKVNNESIYKSYLRWEKPNYFDQYDKTLYTEIWDRNNVEWLWGISFSYSPSPGQIKDSWGNPIGIQLWNSSTYYLQDSHKDFNIDLEENLNYTVKIRSYNWITEDLSLNLRSSTNELTPIILKWELVSKSSWQIQAKITDSKDENDSINSLYVNDVLGK